MSALSKDGRLCGLWGCGRSAVTVANVSTTSTLPKTIAICSYHAMMIRDAEPLAAGVSGAD